MTDKQLFDITCQNVQLNLYVRKPIQYPLVSPTTVTFLEKMSLAKQLVDLYRAKSSIWIELNHPPLPIKVFSERHHVLHPVQVCHADTSTKTLLVQLPELKKLDLSSWNGLQQRHDFF